MSCIICGSKKGNEYYCCINDLWACFCDKHYDKNIKHTCLVIRMKPCPVPAHITNM